ncbi:MAG: SGNH/GDSL hydrolase family protein [Prevotella sp.]|nr:SGNH/GDSL hydrolase family protein [Prevotella sp.]
MKRKVLIVIISVLVVLPAVSQTAITHPWQGKKVAYFGDSITDPNNTAATNKYWKCLQDWLGITPYVYAVSGRQWNDIPRQAEQLQSEHGDDFDAIMIFVGTNDYNKGVPLGEWFSETKEQVMVAVGEPKHLVERGHRTPIMTDSTYRGRINIALCTVKKMFPTKQIVLLTPIHRSGFYANDTNWQPAEDYQNSIGEYLSAYIEATKEAANIWAVPVIDLNALCGLFPLMDEYAPYFNDKDIDRLHPNNTGHERIAKTLMYQLLALPCIEHQ